MANIERGEIVIEIDHQRIIRDSKLGHVSAGNSPVYFYPLDSELRSRIVPARSGAGIRPVWFGIASIPGQRVHVNPKAMKWRVTDALNDDENRNTLAQVKRAVREAQGQLRAVSAEISGGEPEQSGRLSSPAELHNWLYWMRRLVDSGHAVCVQGREDMPSEETLRNGGDIRIPGDPKIAKAESGDIFMKPTPKTEPAAV